MAKCEHNWVLTGTTHGTTSTPPAMHYWCPDCGATSKVTISTTASTSTTSGVK